MSLFDKALGAEIATNNYNRKAKKANQEINAIINDYEKVIAEMQLMIKQLEQERSFHQAEINRLKDKANDLIISRNNYIEENDRLKKQLNK